MSVGAEVIAANTYRVTSRTCMEPGGVELDLRSYMVMVEDHYPATPTYSRNTFREATGTTDFSLAAGECHVDVRDIAVVPETVESNFKVIAWAQVPAKVYPAEVHQAAKDAWPFETLPEVGDYDNDGDVDLDDHTEFPDCMSGPDPVVLPSQECRSAFDSDADDDVDLDDFAAFMVSFTGEE